MKKTVSEMLAEMEASGLAEKAAGSLSIDELSQMFELSDDPFTLISACFNYGYAKGMRAEKNRVKRSKA